VKVFLKVGYKNGRSLKLLDINDIVAYFSTDFLSDLFGILSM